MLSRPDLVSNIPPNQPPGTSTSLPARDTTDVPTVPTHGRDAAAMAKKLLWSTGKEAWIVGATLLVLVVPLIIEMHREQQLNDLKLQQQTLLGATPAK
jgi:hypothetical protein